MITNALAIYGATLSSVVAALQLIGWISRNRPQLDVRLFISPLVFGEDGRPLTQNDFGHPVIQAGPCREYMVIRAHNAGRKTLNVDRVELLGLGDPENLTWIVLPRTLEADDVQLWYSKYTGHDPRDVTAAVIIRGGRVFTSRRYEKLLWYLNPLDPMAGR